jgi:hypothetical protein
MGPRYTYPYSFDMYVMSEATKKDIATKRQANETIIERLIAPDVVLQPDDELKLTAAYYHANFRSYTNAEASLPYPPIPPGKWLAPIRATYLSIDDDALPWSKVLSIPTVADTEEAFAVARDRGHWETFRAASSQLGVLAVDVMLGGPLTPEDNPAWCNVWLQTPVRLAEHEAGMEATKQALEQKGYRIF